MDDKDYVFAQFKDDKPAASDRREMLSIPRKGNTMGSRTVEVVHVRSGGAPAGKGQPRRLAVTNRAATWENGFPARPPAQPPAMVEAQPPARAEPVTHMMPMWEQAAAEVGVAASARGEPTAGPAVPDMAPRNRPMDMSTRRVADPFNTDDDGANCMRCGYAVELAREKRGLLTCARCG